MFYLVYSSSATELLTEEQLLELLHQSRIYNEKVGITGMLLYKDGNFFQVLEGEKHEVEKLYDKICRDVRHHNLILLITGTEEERKFPDWTMAFRNLSGADIASIPGFVDIFDPAVSKQELFSDPSISQKLLLKFKEIM
ncbi:MAG: BLUF domain-containing protein [Ardenticatenaceae bacterium]|nr:BLUF domain-containing protein [Ardenticatenaceae bacterium]